MYESHCGISNETRLLKLTSCPNEQYTCYNGDCIELEKVCDEVDDCLDGSDETYCKTITKDERKYRKHSPPKSNNEKVQVEVHLAIQSLSNIDEVTKTFESKFHLELKWLDHRLDYLYIYGPNNLLSKTSAQTIWLPSLTLSNTLGNLAILDSETYYVLISKDADPIYGQRQALHETLIFSGAENNLVLTDTYDTKLSCAYELKYYPFDSQRCRIDVTLPRTMIPLVKLVSGACTQLSNDFQLSQFQVIQIKNLTLENGVACEIVLKRNPAFHVVSTYLPTLTLIIMALATLFIDEGHVEATIMVAMTSMLVMFTLHQNVQSKVPYTAYLKFVDYWLIYGTLLPFIVFAILVSWELGSGDKKIQDQVQALGVHGKNSKVKRNYFKTVPKYALPVVTIIFTLTYTIVALWLQF